MGERAPWGPLRPTPQGYVQLYDDGSVIVYDPYFNVVSDDASPNPVRAALARAGREEDAAAGAAFQSASDEDTRRWNLNYGLENRQIDQRADGLRQRARQINNEYELGKRSARTNEERLALDRWYQQEQIGLAKARLGYDLISTAAQMRGANNYFQASNLRRGYAGEPGTAAFLSSLQGNTRLPGFQASAGTPDAFTLGRLTSELAGGAGAGGNAVGGTADNAYLRQIHGIGAAGGHKVGAGVLEAMTPDEIGLLVSGLEAPDENGRAFNASDFLADWRNSRIGQQVGGGRRA